MLSDRVIVLTEMIAQMYGGACSPRVVPKRHAWVIDLMNYVVKLILLTQSSQLKLASPDTILLNVTQILIYGLIILDEGREEVLILLNIGHCFLSILRMKRLIAL